MGPENKRIPKIKANSYKEILKYFEIYKLYENFAAKSMFYTFSDKLHFYNPRDSILEMIVDRKQHPRLFKKALELKKYVNLSDLVKEPQKEKERKFYYNISRPDLQLKLGFGKAIYDFFPKMDRFKFENYFLKKDTTCLDALHRLRPQHSDPEKSKEILKQVIDLFPAQFSMGSEYLDKIIANSMLKTEVMKQKELPVKRKGILRLDVNRKKRKQARKRAKQGQFISKQQYIDQGFTHDYKFICEVVDNDNRKFRYFMKNVQGFSKPHYEKAVTKLVSKVIKKYNFTHVSVPQFRASAYTLPGIKKVLHKMNRHNAIQVMLQDSNKVYNLPAQYLNADGKLNIQGISKLEEMCTPDRNFLVFELMTNGELLTNRLDRQRHAPNRRFEIFKNLNDVVIDMQYVLYAEVKKQAPSLPEADYKIDLKRSVGKGMADRKFFRLFNKLFGNKLNEYYNRKDGWGKGNSINKAFCHNDLNPGNLNVSDYHNSHKFEIADWEAAGYGLGFNDLVKYAYSSKSLLRGKRQEVIDDFIVKRFKDIAYEKLSKIKKKHKKAKKMETRARKKFKKAKTLDEKRKVNRQIKKWSEIKEFYDLNEAKIENFNTENIQYHVGQVLGKRYENKYGRAYVGEARDLVKMTMIYSKIRSAGITYHAAEKNNLFGAGNSELQSIRKNLKSAYTMTNYFLNKAETEKNKREHKRLREFQKEIKNLSVAYTAKRL